MPEAALHPAPRRISVRDVGLVLACFGVAWALKAHYATASAGELAWVLGPTVSLVELATGAPFPFEAGAGWLSVDLVYLIGPSCAGVNFMVAAICAGTLGLSRFVTTGRGALLLLVGSSAAAFLLTVVVNALRIVIAVRLHTSGMGFGPLGGADLHRAEGVVVYVTALCVAYLLAQAALARRGAPLPHPRRTEQIT